MNYSPDSSMAIPWRSAATTMGSISARVHQLVSEPFLPSPRSSADHRHQLKVLDPHQWQPHHQLEGDQWQHHSSHRIHQESHQFNRQQPASDPKISPHHQLQRQDAYQDSRPGNHLQTQDFHQPSVHHQKTPSDQSKSERSSSSGVERWMQLPNPSSQPPKEGTVGVAASPSRCRKISPTFSYYEERSDPYSTTNPQIRSAISSFQQVDFLAAPSDLEGRDASPKGEWWRDSSQQILHHRAIEGAMGQQSRTTAAFINLDQQQHRDHVSSSAAPSSHGRVGASPIKEDQRSKAVIIKPHSLHEAFRTPLNFKAKKLTPTEILEREKKGVCFLCDDKFEKGHVCKIRTRMPMVTMDYEGRLEDNSEAVEETIMESKSEVIQVVEDEVVDGVIDVDDEEDEGKDSQGELGSEAAVEDEETQRGWRNSWKHSIEQMVGAVSSPISDSKQIQEFRQTLEWKVAANHCWRFLTVRLPPFRRPPPKPPPQPPPQPLNNSPPKPRKILPGHFYKQMVGAMTESSEKRKGKLQPRRIQPRRHLQEEMRIEKTVRIYGCDAGESPAAIKEEKTHLQEKTQALKSRKPSPSDLRSRLRTRGGAYSRLAAVEDELAVEEISWRPIAVWERDL